MLGPERNIFVSYALLCTPSEISQIKFTAFCFLKVVKVADFGVARFQNQGGEMTAETGTYRWMAPEV